MVLVPPRWMCRLALGLLALDLAIALPANAQDYPNQTLKIVVPFVAGGGVDVVARIIAPNLSEELGQPVIIENRGGAGGMIGAAAVAQAPPDGYTLLVGTGSTHGTNSSVYSHLPYDPVRDFTPIGLISSSPLLLIVPPPLPATSVGELIALARSRPGELSFGSYGTGSINHLGAELFNSMAKIEANHVPYRGSAPALTDLMAGRLHYMFDGISTSLGYLQAGTIRALGVAGANRSLVLPDQPTISEAGLPGYDTMVWFGLFAPAGTPRSIVVRVNSATNAVLASPRIKEALEKLGIDPVGGSPGVLASKVQSELQKWAAIVREKNIRVDQ
ncbi:MAG TPA: tripartite tricarboxylate transporter substrate binding protein [Xanthobacteraceae bacterium]|nr:tripartite tricarboxylate transporter substrate binding protein [Xanthobacteraceae bacterium]